MYISHCLVVGWQPSVTTSEGDQCVPNQEAYDARAFPRKYIDETASDGASAAFARSAARAGTSAGSSALRRAGAAAAWQSVGPTGGKVPDLVTYTGVESHVSGRVTSMAIWKKCVPGNCLLIVGTAGGGVWRTANALAAHPVWKSVGASIPSQAIGEVYFSPKGVLYVGTGEENGSSDSEAGVGLYKSTDKGTTFKRVKTMALGRNFAKGRAIGAIAVDPRNARHIVVGTSVARHGSSSVNGGRFTPPGAMPVGVYESKNNGRTWKLALVRPGDSVDPTSGNGGDFFRGGINQIKFDPVARGTFYAAVMDYGLFRRAANKWTQIYTSNAAGSPALSSDARVEFDVAKLPTKATRIYLGDSLMYDDAVSGLVRTDDARTATPSWTELSDPTSGTPGYSSYNFCQGQCGYDIAVNVPKDDPDQVVLSGSMNYDEIFTGTPPSNGRAVVRSTNAGVSFTDMTNDVENNGLHPDHHALVFAPNSHGNVFFSGSDGGVVRQSGPFVDASAECASRGLSATQQTNCEGYLKAIPTSNTDINDGLNTLQFQSAFASHDDSAIQGGTQDNGTWESDFEGGWAETVGGDGGNGGFNATDSSIRYHAYYGAQLDVSFDSGKPPSWNWIGDVLGTEAGSFYVPIEADPVTSGTVFLGQQHVWRTLDNGGDRNFLEQYCNELTGDYGNRPDDCGDWVPLGGADGDLSGDNGGNYVVAIARAKGNSGTMWAATRRGDVFVTDNADAANEDDVTFTQVNTTLGLPKRFVSGISIDPTDPHHVWLSYSGYSAYAAGGHVFDVTFDPSADSGTKTDLSHNLGDQPITSIVRTDSGALYAGTDFGVVTIAPGGSSWVATKGLPKVAVYGLSLSPSGSMVIAATHGRGIYKLPLQ